MSAPTVRGLEQFTCAMCAKKINGLLIDEDTWEKLTLDADDDGEWEKIALQCLKCKVVLCLDCCKKHMKKSLWSGYEKSTCPKCQGTFGPPPSIISTEKLAISSIKILNLKGYSVLPISNREENKQQPDQKDAATILRELKSLHDAGILSDAEYEEKRKKHLASL